MELFRYRPFLLGCLGFLVLTLTAYYFGVLSLIVALLFSLALAAVVTVPLFRPASPAVREKRLGRFLQLFPLCVFLLFGTLYAHRVFVTKEAEIRALAGRECNAEVTVLETEYEDLDTGRYRARVLTDEVRGTFNVVLTADYPSFLPGERFPCRLAFRETEMEEDEPGYYRRNGILIAASTVTIGEVYGRNPMVALFTDTNAKLGARLSRVTDAETASFVGAILLGNRSSLPKETVRDFSRSGTSHLLALSGLHLAMLSLLLDFFLQRAGLGNRTRSLIIIPTILFFVALTGFSTSTVRAGTMLIIWRLFRLFLRRYDTPTTLLFAVFLIVLFDPYAAVDAGLQFSCLSTLACIRYHGMMRRTRLARRHPIFACLLPYFFSSFPPFLFSLPIAALRFHTVPLLAFVANPVATPIFAVVLTLSPLLLIFGNVPFLGTLLSRIVSLASTLLIGWVKTISRLPGSAVRIDRVGLWIGVSICCLGIAVGVLAGRSKFRRSSAVVCVGIIVFTVALFARHSDRMSHTGVSFLAKETDEYLIVEESDHLLFADMTDAPTWMVSDLVKIAEGRGYTELDYLLTAYTEDAQAYLAKLEERFFIRRIYAPIPSEEETPAYRSLCRFASQHDVEVIAYLRDAPLRYGGASFYLHSDDSAISARPLTALTVQTGEHAVTYLGSGCFDAPDALGRTDADVLILGAHGPAMQKAAVVCDNRPGGWIVLSPFVSYASRLWFSEVPAETLYTTEYDYQMNK